VEAIEPISDPDNPSSRVTKRQIIDVEGPDPLKDFINEFEQDRGQKKADKLQRCKDEGLMPMWQRPVLNIHIISSLPSPLPL
jgi:hypothetical protein